METKGKHSSQAVKPSGEPAQQQAAAGRDSRKEDQQPAAAAADAGSQEPVAGVEYEVISPLRYDQRRYEIGERVRLGLTDAEKIALRGALRPA